MELRAEGILVEAHDGRLARCIIDGQNIEAAEAGLDAALGHKALCGANDHGLLGGSDAELRESLKIFAHGASTDFDECEGIAVITDEVDFPFHAPGHEISSYEDVSEAPQIPVAIGFSTNAGLARGLFSLAGGKRIFIAQASPGAPMEGAKNETGENSEVHG